ncbi:MAG TPA: RNA methyltransferase, partial [Bacteroidota bacterium]|nr:RNA methyltransferase [Bacteroidota bacterium]
GVVIPKHHAASVTSAVVKASAGATEHMAMAEVTNIVSTLEDLKGRGFWTAGVAVEGDIPFTAFDYTTPAAIVVGNEGKGIRRLVREHCDSLVRIPMYGKLGSLNASVAGALVMYEAARQRHRT